MVYVSTRIARAADPTGIELVLATSDYDLFGMALVQGDAYGSPQPASRDELPARRAAMRRGAIAMIARDVATGAVVGAGSCSPIVGGLSEVAAVGVAATHRRRGIARTLAHRLANEAIAGFTTIGEILHISW